ncbi:sensor histidine kinase [Longispora urticae]
MRLRTRLTLLYAGPFLLSGAALVSVPILQTRQSEPVGPGTGGPPPAPAPELGNLITVSVLGLAVMVVVALALGWWIAGRFVRPLRAITATARDISASNLHRRLGKPGGGEEFTQLAATLDDLFARLEASFASQRHFVANASHELRTPLTAERALLQVALADPEPSVDRLRAVCRDVLALGGSQERLIDALLTLASSEQGIEHPEPFDLADVARGVVASRGDARVSTALATAPALGDRSLAGSLVANLVDNALRYNVPGGTVEVETSAGRIAVRNTGPVVPAGEVEGLFEPFRRLGDQRTRHDGHGLGLAIVRAIAGAHGATVSARARPAGGLAIEVTFPAVP